MNPGVPLKETTRDAFYKGHFLISCSNFYHDQLFQLTNSHPSGGESDPCQESMNGSGDVVPGSKTVAPAPHILQEYGLMGNNAWSGVTVSLLDFGMERALVSSMESCEFAVHRDATNQPTHPACLLPTILPTILVSIQPTYQPSNQPGFAGMVSFSNLGLRTRSAKLGIRALDVYWKPDP